MRIARLLLGLSSGHAVLDVACGPGNFTRSFGRAVGDARPRGRHRHLDDDARARRPRHRAERPRQRLPRPRRRDGAARSPTASFDAVCCFAALHLFADPFDALTDMARVLGAGWTDRDHDLGPPPGQLPPLKPVIERISGMRVFEHDEIVSALQARGFTDVHQRVSGLVQFVGGRLADPRKSLRVASAFLGPLGAAGREIL